MKLRLTLLTLATVGAAISSAQAPDVRFYFTQLGSSTEISNLTIGGPGSTLSFSVWYETPNSFTHTDFNIFLGIDRTNVEFDPGTAPRLDNEVDWGGGTTNSAVVNRNTAFENYGFINNRGAAPDSDGPIRPWGSDIAASVAPAGNTRSSATPLRLFDVNLTNLNITAGESYDIVIYHLQGYSGTDGTSLIALGNTSARPAGSTFLTLTNPVPEPASLAALGLGALALLRRRRRK